MIVTNAEVEELERLQSSPLIAETFIVDFIRDKPHLFLPCGFDEIRLAVSVPCPAHEHLPRETRYCYRKTSSGAWYMRSGWAEGRSSEMGIFEFQYKLKLIGGGQELKITTSDILRGCRLALTVFDDFGVVVLPDLWLPPDKHGRIEVVDATVALLNAIKAERISLADASWRQLEQIVAELLRSRGMVVKLTPPSADGGRDILARGELLPGEPMTLAVEVKHKPVVGLDEVRARLWANRQFPALLFATSGRYSAGVIREKQKPENHLRLILKDGIALGQWIKAYNPVTTETSRFL